MTVEVAGERAVRRVDRPDAPGGGAPSLRVVPGRRLRAAVVVGSDTRVAQAMRRALLSAGLESVLEVAVPSAGPFGVVANAFRAARVDVVLAQSDERGADRMVDLLDAVVTGCAAQESMPLVVASGAHAERLGAAVAPLPAFVLEDLRSDDALARFVDRMRELRRPSGGAIVLRDEALEGAARLVARVTGAAALVVDVSGASTSLVRAEPAGTVHAAHLVPFGVGGGADRVVARVGLEHVRRWIPRSIDGPSLIERVFNRARWPDAVPASPLALALEMALAREAIAHALGDADSLGLPPAALRCAPTVALTGLLAALPRPAQSLLVAIDALEPPAASSFVRERDDGLVALGALDAAAAQEGVFADAIERLALVVPVATRGRANVRVVRGGVREQVRVEPGALLALAASGMVEVSGGSPEATGRGEAGACGVLLDARGRPLVLAQRDAERLPMLMRWFAALDALPGGVA